jgi:hypothetical protein
VSFPVNSLAQNIDEYRASINSAGGIEKFLQKMEREVSKTLPRAKDQFTEFVSVSSYGRTISFYTKIKNATRDQIGNNHSAISETKTQSINSLCSLPLSKLIINEYGAVYKYVVLAMDGAYAFEYVVDKSKCASV